ncbi:MAG: hypothetical protein O9301_00500 [Leptospira sp.]|nr:hypothetical protein [Leptospira sp.]
MQITKKKTFWKNLLSLILTLSLLSTCTGIYIKERKDTYNMEIERIEENLHLVTLNFLITPKGDVGSGLILYTIITCDIAEFGVKKEYTYMLISPISGKTKRDSEKNISRINVDFYKRENKQEFIKTINQKLLLGTEIYETEEYFKQCTEYLESRKR